MHFALITIGLTAACLMCSADVTLYAPDPQHLWNRLHSALIIRAPEADAAINDLLDPPFWADTKHLLAGETNRRAIALLDEFVKGQPFPEAMSAWQRAVMQRDLLGVFHWLAERERSQRGEWTASQRELSTALAHAIRHVALTEEEIRKLPDNYAAAVAAPDTITAFDAAHPGPFLPKDLLADNGPWIALQPNGDDGMAATVHFEFFHGRSAFEVRMRHPDGRAPGEAYLKQLAQMPKPFVQEKPEQLFRLLPHSDPALGPWPNPETPQFPPGTMWALVRRAILADTMGAPVVSSLVESVQIRVYRDLAARDFDQAQTAFEWETRHALLLGQGGFHVTKPEDQQFGHFPDIYEPRPEKRSNQLSCYQCHSAAGIHSVNSRARLFEDQLSRPPEFHAVDRARVDGLTSVRARVLPNWVLLQWLWEDRQGR